MVRLCVPGEEQMILDYIGEDYPKCLYLYMDLLQFGLDNENVNVWADIESDGEVRFVMLRYYSALHPFSRKMNFDLEGVIKIICDIKPEMICGVRKMIDRLKSSFADTYDLEYGYVGKIDQIKLPVDESFQRATAEDLCEIAQLIISSDEIGRSFEFGALLQQLSERFGDKFARNYVLRKGDKIIAHVDTSAENERIGIISGVITLPEYRGQNLATRGLTKLCNDLKKEGKEIFSFFYIPAAIKMHEKVGFYIYDEWAKMVIQKK